MHRKLPRAQGAEPKLRPAVSAVARQSGMTVGMVMTEKQDGTDLRANTTVATPNGDGYARCVLRRSRDRARDSRGVAAACVAATLKSLWSLDRFRENVTPDTDCR